MTETWSLTHDNTPWTEVQDQVILRAFGKAPVERIAMVLGRRVTAVNFRARRLGATARRSRWTVEDVSRLADMRSRGVPIERAAEELGRTADSCRSKVMSQRRAGDARFAVTGRRCK